LVGLAIFLGIRLGSFALSTGEILVVAASLATGAGLLVAEKMKPDPETSLEAKVRASTKKTFYTCLISGGGTTVTLAALNLLPQNTLQRFPALDLLTQQQFPAGNTWIWIVALALVGNCLTWLSVFLLIAFDETILAAAAMATAPVMTEIANYLWFKPTVTSQGQWLGGLMVLLALSGLIWLQLKDSGQESEASFDLAGGKELADA
jgi:hypothetical protein